jgi:hypothetical protein
MTVRRLLSEIDSRELSEWMAYDRLKVSDSWQQNAQLCVVVAKSMGGKKCKAQFKDFLPWKPRRARSGDELKAKMLRFAGRQNAKLKERI